MTTKKGRPTKAEQRDTRAILLASAIELFSEEGFAKVDLRRIAEHADVSLGLIRHHFGSKDGLIEETTKVVVKQLEELFQAMITNLQANDGLEFIDRLAERSLEFLMPRYKLLFYLRQLSVERSEASLDVFNQYFSLVRSELMTLEVAGQLSTDINRVWLTFILMFLHFGPIFLDKQIQEIIGRNHFDPAIVHERVTSAARILKHGMLPISGPPSQAVKAQQPSLDAALPHRTAGGS